MLPAALAGQRARRRLALAVTRSDRSRRASALRAARMRSRRSSRKACAIDGSEAVAPVPARRTSATRRARSRRTRRRRRSVSVSCSPWPEAYAAFAPESAVGPQRAHSGMRPRARRQYGARSARAPDSGRRDRRSARSRACARSRRAGARPRGRTRPRAGRRRASGRSDPARSRPSTSVTERPSRAARVNAAALRDQHCTGRPGATSSGVSTPITRTRSRSPEARPHDQRVAIDRAHDRRRHRSRRPGAVHDARAAGPPTDRRGRGDGEEDAAHRAPAYGRRRVHATRANRAEPAASYVFCCRCLIAVRPRRCIER